MKKILNSRMIQNFKNVPRFRFIILIVCLLVLGANLSAYFSTYGEFVSRFEDAGHGDGITGVTNDAVILDDLRSDWNYYMGLNYTNSDDGTLPTGANQEIYNQTNLVQSKIIYDGTDLDTDLVGYVSRDESQYVYMYYKSLPVNDNGTSSLSDDYVEFELIDNPFTYRPTDKAFNGWTTSYEDAFLSFDNVYYTRTVKVPVTYTSGIPDNLNITFNANWIDSTNTTVSTSRSWATAFGNLDSAGMKQILPGERVIEYAPYSMAGYYHRVTVPRNTYYNTGTWYDVYGNLLTTGRCRTSGGCTQYTRITNENFDANSTYYHLVNGYMTLLDNSTINLTVISDEFVVNEDIAGANVAGFYRTVTISYGSSYSGGYYNNLGVKQNSGTCYTSGGCTFYELIQYYDSLGNEEIADNDLTYYYLVTRDTNIITMTNSMTTTWSSSQNKPFTLTSDYGTDYRSSVSWNIATYSSSYWSSSYSGTAVYAYADMAIENIKISTGTAFTSIWNPNYGSSSAGEFIGNFHNVKLGRGIVKNGTYGNFVSVIGGSNSSSGSSSNVTKYKLMIESGFYNSGAFSNGVASGTTPTVYMEGKAVYGNDYDKADGVNTKLDFYYCASGSWGGYYYASTTAGISFDLTVKSGNFGSSHYDNTTGIYVGGRYGGTHYTSRMVHVEGGHIYNLIGGPLTASNRGSINDTYMYIKNGVVDMIIAGAGQTATYGNRIVQVTGGMVSYSVFGGSNGSDGGSGDGTINGSSFVYVGGASTIGDADLVQNNNVLYGAEAGSVFGIGNGNSNYESIGSNSNSNIIINEDCLVRRNVYGGGNFAAVGISSGNATTNTTIQIKGGTVNGSVYGGGNKNGSGNANMVSTVDITMTGGHVVQGLYGGANEKGTIYGNVNLNIYSGQVGDVYGGGRGGFDSSTAPGTFVTGDVDVAIGNSEIATGPTIDNVYGGSAYGTVNGSTRTSAINTINSTNVTVNKGDIGSVFGGGKGNNNYIPYVEGNVVVEINGGDIEKVFGGNDAQGTPNGTVIVYLDGGTIVDSYGGGNLTAVPVTNVYLRGATCTNVYGGSRQLGDATTSNVTISDGLITNVFGGNDQGGTVTTSNVLLNGNDASVTNIYGGGNLASTGTTNVRLVNGTVTGNVYGGGNGEINGGAADVTVKSNVTLNGALVSGIFGGSNSNGTVTQSEININLGTATDVYGGNNQGGTTTTTRINLEGGRVRNVYGGGNNATSTTSNIVLDGTSASNIYGGGNSAGLTTSNIDLKSGSVTNVFGGSNQLGNVNSSNITTSSTLKTNVVHDTDLQVDVDATAVAVNPNYQNTDYNSVVTLDVTLTNNTDSAVSSWVTNITALDSILYTNYSFHDIAEDNGVYTINQTNRYDSLHPKVIPANGTYSFSFTIYSNDLPSDFSLDDYNISGSNEAGDALIQNDNNLLVSNLYGGNNRGGTTATTNLDLDEGYIYNVYGGGNYAPVTDTNVSVTNLSIAGALYGGGNNAAVTHNTNVDLIGANVVKSVFGGGNNGAVGNDTDVFVSSSNVGNSVYAGGNGIPAVVDHQGKVTIEGNSVIADHVFGGGNAAATGVELENDAKTIVDIVGGTIGGNVYGGGNTSKVYGETEVNIGYNTITNNASLVKGDILIGGTVFGGGEANASGNPDYDWKYISVYVGVDINIDGSSHNNFNINGSIFGSGNASSIAVDAYSNIDIKNYGTVNDIKKNVSIQRVENVVIDNSFMELTGAVDSTIFFDTDLFAFSIVDSLNIKNGTTLYLKAGGNMLQYFKSSVDIGGQEVLSTVLIDEINKTVVKNTDNRIYMYEGKSLNIAYDDHVQSPGNVDGMTFLGMYNYDRYGNIDTALYDCNLNYEDSVSSSDIYHFTKGTYVLGKHKKNPEHEIEADGFYSNFDNPDDTGKILVKYIDPPKKNLDSYTWSIGDLVDNYEIEHLKASKYLTLGAANLPLNLHADANTTFEVVGFNYDGLEPGVELVDQNSIPRVAETSQIADTRMSLVMKTTNTGWMTNGETEFLSDDATPFTGTTEYFSENSDAAPVLEFYLYHSKNLGSTGDLGSVTISLIVVTPITPIQNEISRVNIIVNLERELLTSSDYEASITPGKQYGLFASSNVDITNKGSFSSYYSLFVEDTNNLYQTGYHRSLVSSYLLPVNTKITMIDYHDHSDPDYYYYVVSPSDYQTSLLEYNQNQNQEVSYDFSKFIRMGSTSPTNNYDDALGNAAYYNSTDRTMDEEFIFIVDFSESGITTDVSNQTLYMELRDIDNRPKIGVFGIQSSLMYNLYEGKDAQIDIQGTLDQANIHPGDQVNLDVNTNYIQQTHNGTSSGRMVYDTKYFDNQLGIKITLYDNNHQQVTGASLLGFSYTLNGVNYYPRMDGSIRLNIADRVSNVASRIRVNTNKSLAAGNYTMRIESFGSPDGIYYGLTSSDYTEIPFVVLNTVYGLKVSLQDKQVIINKNTGHTLNGNNAVVFNYRYNSVLNDPNIRISLLRRDYSATYSTNYELVNIKDFVTNNYETTNILNKYLLTDTPGDNATAFMYMKSNLKTGTYKVVFSLYDGNSYIGEVYQYLIIK